MIKGMYVMFRPKNCHVNNKILSKFSRLIPLKTIIARNQMIFFAVGKSGPLWVTFSKIFMT